MKTRTAWASCLTVLALACAASAGEGKASSPEQDREIERLKQDLWDQGYSDDEIQSAVDEKFGKARPPESDDRKSREEPAREPSREPRREEGEKPHEARNEGPIDQLLHRIDDLEADGILGSDEADDMRHKVQGHAHDRFPERAAQYGNRMLDRLVRRRRMIQEAVGKGASKQEAERAADHKMMEEEKDGGDDREMRPPPPPPQDGGDHADDDQGPPPDEDFSDEEVDEIVEELLQEEKT